MAAEVDDEFRVVEEGVEDPWEGAGVWRVSWVVLAWDGLVGGGGVGWCLRSLPVVDLWVGGLRVVALRTMDLGAMLRIVGLGAKALWSIALTALCLTSTFLRAITLKAM